MGKRHDGLDDRVTLIEAMLAVAHADGDFSDVEKKRMLQLMEFLRLGGDAAAHVKGLIDSNTAPPMPQASELPDYDTRRYIFQHALIMAFEDGEIESGEKRHLDALADLFELDPNDVQRGWDRAREMTDTA